MTESKAITILLVADNEIVRHGLRQMLESVEDMEVVGDCASATEAIPKVAELHPNIVLLDTKMPGTNGIEAIRSLKRKELDYDSDIIILAESLDYRGEALKAGTASYLLKNITDEELTQAIRQVYRDREEAGDAVEVVISPPSNAAQLFRYMCQLEELLHDHPAIITSTIGSWDQGLVITVQLRLSTASSLLIKLASMPEVEKVEEQPLAGRTFAGKLILRSCPSKRFSVTLKE